MKQEADDMAWHERNLALEAQVRVTLLDVQGELCMEHGTAGPPAGALADIPAGGIQCQMPAACQAQLKALVMFSSEMGCLRLQREGER